LYGFGEICETRNNPTTLEIKVCVAGFRITGADGHYRKALYRRPVWKMKGMRRSTSLQHTVCCRRFRGQSPTHPPKYGGWLARSSALSNREAANTVAPAILEAARDVEVNQGLVLDHKQAPSR
jgi:hypothetical protein